MTTHTNPGHQRYLARRHELREAAARVHGARVDELVAEDLADVELCRALAAWVERYRAKHGHGPTWADLAAQCRPDAGDDIAPRAERAPMAFRLYAGRLCAALAAAGWIRTGRERGSMRPGSTYTGAPAD